jgi:hypothetical protein
MAVKVRKATLWRAEVRNEPGALAAALAPLAGEDLQVVMGYHYYGESANAVVDVTPITSRKAIAAAREAGFAPLSASTLIVEGDNRAGIGRAVGQALGQVGINMDSLTAQVVGRKFQAVFGFENDADAKKAALLIKKAVAGAARKTKKAKTAKK